MHWVCSVPGSAVSGPMLADSAPAGDTIGAGDQSCWFASNGSRA